MTYARNFSDNAPTTCTNASDQFVTLLNLYRLPAGTSYKLGSRLPPTILGEPLPFGSPTGHGSTERAIIVALRSVAPQGSLSRESRSIVSATTQLHLRSNYGVQQRTNRIHQYFQHLCTIIDAAARYTVNNFHLKPIHVALTSCSVSPAPRGVEVSQTIQQPGRYSERPI